MRRAGPLGEAGPWAPAAAWKSGHKAPAASAHVLFPAIVNVAGRWRGSGAPYRPSLRAAWPGPVPELGQRLGGSGRQGGAVMDGDEERER